MKKFAAALVVAAAAMSWASAALADKVSYCQDQAEQAVHAATHPVASTAIGCGVGAAIGSLLSNGNGGAIAGGCVAGGVGGAMISADKQQQIRQQAFSDCMASGSGGSGGGSAASPAAYTTFAPPSGTAVTPLNTTVNLRAGPGTSNFVLESVPANTTVNVSQCARNNGNPNDEWCQSQTPTNTGWISKKLLSFN